MMYYNYYYKVTAKAYKNASRPCTKKATSTTLQVYCLVGAAVSLLSPHAAHPSLEPSTFSGSGCLSQRDVAGGLFRRPTPFAVVVAIVDIVAIVAAIVVVAICVVVAVLLIAVLLVAVFLVAVLDLSGPNSIDRGW